MYKNHFKVRNYSRTLSMSLLSVSRKLFLMRMVPACGYLLWCLLMAQASLQLDIGKIVVPQTCI